ncbi:MAG: hypothetical protein ACI8XO_000351 [Verrucomicrobiales bacterium]|jgi:hypothetical protein
MKMSFAKLIAAGIAVTAFMIPAASAQLVPSDPVVPFASTWGYLLYAPEAGGFVPTDPETVDDDFYDTWHSLTGYNGPDFQIGQAPLGYDTVTGAPVVTDIWVSRDGNDQPPTGDRYSAYLRTSFTPTADISALQFSGIVDDGAVFYVNGVEVQRANMPAGEDIWTLLASNATATETDAITVQATGLNLPAGVEVAIGVSLHNAGSGSSDLGMDIEISPLIAPEPTPPDNDDFSAAINIVGDLPQTVTGRTHDAAVTLGFGATKEAGEPAHPSGPNVGSIWYTYIPVADGSVQVTAGASTFNSLIAVYTGSSVSGLTEVASAADGITFYDRATVFFDVDAGITYYIAVSGEDGGGAPVLGAEFGTVTVTVSELPEPLFTPIATVLPAGSDWSYLIAAEANTDDPPLPNQPVDPALFGAGDADFHSTWHTAASYDGPPFEGPAPALLGYGAIDAAPIATDIWGARDIDDDPATNDLAPPTTLRYAAYLRTTFTPTSAIPHLGFRGLIDDGAVIYVNGNRVSDINFIGDPSNWQAFALANGTEVSPQEGIAPGVNLPANVPVEIGVTLRNANNTSSDMGFDLEIYSIEAPVVDFGDDLATNDPFKASFDNYDAGDTEGDGSAGSEDSLPWTGVALSDELALPNSQNGAGNVMYVNNGSFVFRSGNIDLRNVDNSDVAATVDLRSFQTSTSGFEANDIFDAYIEGSTDGVVFARLTTIKTLAGDADGVINNGELDLLENLEGSFTTFSSNAGAIADNIASIRVVVTAVNTSNSEHFYLDNVVVGTAVGPPPAFTIASITRNQVTGQNTIIWEIDDVSVYTLFYSRSDLSGWTSIRSDFGLSTFNHTTTDAEGFYYVMRELD